MCHTLLAVHSRKDIEAHSKAVVANVTTEVARPFPAFPSAGQFAALAAALQNLTRQMLSILDQL